MKRDDADTVVGILEEYSADQVRKLFSWLIEEIEEHENRRWIKDTFTISPDLRRKTDIVPALKKMLNNPKVLKYIFGSLSEIDKLAIREAVYDASRYFNPQMFEGKYGRLPSLLKNNYAKVENLLPLIISLRNRCADEIAEKMKKFIPPPPIAEIKTIDKLPEEVHTDYIKRTLTQHTSEPYALHDAAAVLHFIETGKVYVSEKSGFPTKAAADKLRDVLVGGDYYPSDVDTTDPVSDKFDVEMGTRGIKPVAWCLMVQAGGLAAVKGGKLKLTKEGRTALSVAPETILKTLWSEWLTTDIIHELNRVEIIKGQYSRKRPLNDARTCRKDIAKGLKSLPIGEWVSLDEFFRFLHAKKLSFVVVNNEWELYVSDKQYGNLGYEHVTWDHLEGRFASAFLLEYAATLGIIDVAYIPPWGAAQDIHDLWGLENYSCISRYDGLRYIRLNPLGAWILGRSKKYTAPEAKEKFVLKILPNLEITIISPEIPSYEKMQLDRIADQTSDRVWKLSKKKILSALEQSASVETIADYLANRSEEEKISPAVTRFLEDVRRGTEKVIEHGQAMIYRCDNNSTAQLIANDSLLKNKCLVNDSYLIVPEKHRTVLKRVFKKLGIVVIHKDTDT